MFVLIVRTVRRGVLKCALRVELVGTLRIFKNDGRVKLLELGLFKFNDWAGILLNYPTNLRKLTKNRKKVRKKEKRN